MNAVRRFAVVALFVCLVAGIGLAQSAPNALQIPEDKIQFQLYPEPMLIFVASNSSSAPIQGSFKFEVLGVKQKDPQNRELVDDVLAWSGGTFKEDPGQTVEKLSWPVKSLPSDDLDILGVLRLRYTFTPETVTGMAPISGTVSMDRIMSNRFGVTMIGASTTAAGRNYPVRVRVDDPANGSPIAGVPVEVAFELDWCHDDKEDDKPQKRSVITDHSGYATLEFAIPEKTTCSEGHVEAAAKRGDFKDSVFSEFKIPQSTWMTITTDKPLYQPGQTVHARVMAFGPNQHVLPGAKIELKIRKGEDREEQLRKTVTTSSFGVASLDWEIPRKLALGDYSIQAEMEKANGMEDSEALASVRISRYDLPTFYVKVKPDQKYYAPGKNAHLEISADYLFGKPVQHAKVRIVRQDQGMWDRDTGRWTAEESNPVLGEFDANGKFSTEIDLQPEKDLEKTDRWARYKDVNFAVYVTDLSTGLTEQQRFDLRVTIHPIHVYTVGITHKPNGDVEYLYITTAYADGTPASVSAKLIAIRDQNEWPLTTFQTNEYGVGRVLIPRIPEQALYSDYDYYDRCSPPQGEPDVYTVVKIDASDANGLHGVVEDSVGITQAKKQYVGLELESVLLRPGEPIKAKVSSSEMQGEFVVSVIGKDELLASQLIRLSEGKGEVSIPSTPEFRGELSVSVYSPQLDLDELRSRATVIYSGPHGLNVALKTDRTTLLPGETVNADIEVRDPNKRGAESAIGVVVYDRAVAERARTEQKLSRDFGFSSYGDVYYQYGTIAGTTFDNLAALDPAKPFSEAQQLLARALLLNKTEGYYGRQENSEKFASHGGYPDHFQTLVEQGVKKVENALQAYTATNLVPLKPSDFVAVVKAAGTDFEALRDPWGMPCRYALSYFGNFGTLLVTSDGPDKLPNTPDDIIGFRTRWQYFLPIGRKMNQAITQYFDRTGGYVRDYAVLRGEMANLGVDLDGVRDPWGNPYEFKFEASGHYFVIRAVRTRRSDSCSRDEWQSRIQYFQKERADLVRALAEHYDKTGIFPQSEEQLKPVLAAAELTGSRALDPWGRPYYFTFEKRKQYGDRADLDSFAVYPNQPMTRTKVTPVTEDVAYIFVMSGPNPKDLRNSFWVTSFSRVVAEQSSKDGSPVPTPSRAPLAQGKGGIAGTITDSSGVSVITAEVVAISELGKQYKAKTDDNGQYKLANLPAGYYRAEISAKGFETSVILEVPVNGEATTNVDCALRTAARLETVDVNVIQSSTALTAIQSVVLDSKRPHSPSDSTPLFTPRVRQDFKETLFWHPEVITDAKGRAHISFPMADNITGWNMSVIASTRSGQLGVAEKEIRSFQPFFVEHDPPKTLTVGDRINLPVVLRNYTDKPITVQTEIKPEAWFSILSKPRQQATIAANGNTNVVFDFRADAAIMKGKQRVTARNSSTGDAIEREVLVHPDGQQINFASAKILAGDDNSFDIDIPKTAIEKSVDSQLKLYPSLIAHVMEAMTGIGKLPTGCVEQTTSTAYVNLLGLKLMDKQGINRGSAQADLVLAAKAAVQQGYEKVVDAQGADGGFGYWKKAPSDLALTAYVIRFLAASKDHVVVDHAVMARARQYLISKQTDSGAWTRWDWQKQGEVEDIYTTSEIARTLALALSDSRNTEEERNKVQASVKAAMDYLAIYAWKDAYVVANYAMAANLTGAKEHMPRARAMLADLAHRRGIETYWELETNTATTPYYGWGRTGLLETTSLAVQALLASGPEVKDNIDQIDGGLQYLLANKDRHGLWYSTHATQTVIETIAAAMPEGSDKTGASRADVIVNGTKAGTIDLPAAEQVVGPVFLDLGQKVDKGKNVIQIVRPENGAPMNVQASTSYYVAWKDSAATNTENVQRGDNSALRLKVHYDRTEVAVGEPIKAEIEVQRIGFRGYGMMIAEIGLPPGVDVDRQSLQDGAGRYEVHPDRVILYVWPDAEGTKLSFMFKLRYRMDAAAAPSVLYDYYNPEANAVVAPVRFVVN